jgi:hypothetical protein
MGQESDEIWTAETRLQPILPKSDRLLVRSDAPVREGGCLHRREIITKSVPDGFLRTHGRNDEAVEFLSTARKNEQVYRFHVRAQLAHSSIHI